jgi:hypothetical protein
MLAVEMASGGMICMQCLMKIGAGIQAILIFYLGNLKDCNVGIIVMRDL